MRRVIGWFVSNPVAANLLMTILVVGGLIAAFQIRHEELPSIEPNLVTVSVPYLGAAPEEVENGVLLRIEEAVEGIEGIDGLTSIANEGYGIVLLTLHSNANRIQTANEIKSRIDAISTFPVETERPVVSLMPYIESGLEIVVSGDTDERTLKELATQLRDGIAALEGVSNVEVAYVRADEISIEVSERTLRRMGLTFDQVANAVRRTSLDMPGGSIRSAAGEILLRTQGQGYTGKDFRDIVVVSGEDGTRVILDEIATIVDGFREGESEARFDGKPAAMVRVNRVGDEDVLTISERVRRYLDEARLWMPEGIEITIALDRSESLSARIGVLLGAAVSGLALVLLFLTVLLRFRLALWVAVGIPVAMLGTIGMLGALGITISTVSVVAFILVLGIVVDDAIVVGERVYVHEQQGKDRLAAACGRHGRGGRAGRVRCAHHRRRVHASDLRARHHGPVGFGHRIRRRHLPALQRRGIPTHPPGTSRAPQGIAAGAIDGRCQHTAGGMDERPATHRHGHRAIGPRRLRPVA